MPHLPSPLACTKNYLDSVATLLGSLDPAPIIAALDVLANAMRNGQTIFIAGNGGSAATATHMANDFQKTVAKTSGRGLRAMALADNTALLTAIANDHTYEEVFSQQIASLADNGDVLIVISGSGNSPNILRALHEATARKIPTIGLLGMNGGKARDLVDVAIVVPSEAYGPIEDLHMILNHLFTDYLQRLP